MAPSAPRVPPAIASALANVPLPMVLVDLPTKQYLQTNQAWQDLFGNRPFEEIVPADDHEDIRRLVGAVADRRLDGYQRLGRFITTEGRQISAHLWLQRLQMDGAPDLAVTVLVPTEHEGTSPAPWMELAGELVNLAVVVTDHDWRVEHVSNDVQKLLGYDPGSLIGTPLLGLVHPDDALKLLQAISVTATTKQALVVRLRLRAANAAWRELVCFVTALCGHKPPRLTLLLSSPASAPAAAKANRTEELEQHLWRIALEVRAAGLIRDVGNTLPADRVREFTELSGRQWEIVTRLVNGQSIAEIARAMYLSPSTVRNHLTVVFRKLGVHSQRELVALMNNAARPRP